MTYINNRGSEIGFALPTVMIASVVMLMVLLSGLVASSSVNATLRDQINDKILSQTVDAASAHVQACLEKDGYVANWTAGSPLRPGSGCGGATSPCGAPTLTLQPQCGVNESANMRSTYSVSAVDGNGTERKVTITAVASNLRVSNRSVVTSRTSTVQQSIIYKNDPNISKPAKRFWLFGTNAGMDFTANGTAPTLVNKCNVPSPTNCVAPEGATVISTKLGELQFWTDGRTIWNKSGLVMFNSSGLNANQSTTQAAAVFPLGGDETRYVVITNTTENGSTNVGRLYYSIVDMTLDGGLGGVTAVKNFALGTGSFSSEALAAAPKSDGTGYWVLTYTPYTTAMVVFGFDNNGNPSGPIAQPANTISPTNYAGLGGFGTLNFNADYSRLVMMAGDHCMSGPCSTREGIVRLMSFNTATGQVGYMNNWSGYPDGAGYSADFSPSGEYIYTSAIYPGRLARYQLTSTSTDASIKASQTYLGSTQPSTAVPCTGGGQVLRAPDNKMYIANCGSNNLSVINAPDAASPNFQYGSFPLGTGQSSYGLPQMVTIYTPSYFKY